MQHKKLKRFFPLWLLVFAGLACSAGSTVTLADIPHPEGWKPMNAGENTLVDAVTDELKKVAGQEGIAADYQVYQIPEGKTWEDVTTFYTQQFRSSWTEDKNLTPQKSEKFRAIGWTYGGMFSEQVVLVAWVEDKDVKTNFVIVILLSE